MLKGDHLGTAVTNFGHWSFDIQVADLYRFMRKILEKYNWNLELAGKCSGNIIKSVQSRQKSGKICVYVSLILKNTGNWQIIIIHTKRCGFQRKNVEKLQNLIRQREIWENFAEECFRDYPQ